MSSDFRYVFEFRDTDWFRQDTCDILNHHNMTFCMYDCGGASRRPRSKLDIKAVYVYFDNTMEGHAAVDAMKMKLLLG